MLTQRVVGLNCYALLFASSIKGADDERRGPRSASPLPRRPTPQAPAGRKEHDEAEAAVALAIMSSVTDSPKEPSGQTNPPPSHHRPGSRDGELPEIWPFYFLLYSKFTTKGNQSISTTSSSLLAVL